jgi:hypothetical protein
MAEDVGITNARFWMQAGSYAKAKYGRPLYSLSAKELDTVVERAWEWTMRPVTLNPAYWKNRRAL